MGRFDISPEVAEEYKQKYKEAAEPHVDEDVLAVGPFRRTGAGTRYGISKMQVGALAYGASTLLSKKKGGGLPSQVLLVVTPTKLVALDYKPRGRGFKVKGPAAAWERSGIKASSKRMNTTTRLTLDADGDKIVMDAEGMGDNPWADEVIRQLGG
jgi:hypothetical protein